LLLEEVEFIFQEGPVWQSGKRNRVEYKRRRALASGGEANAELEIERQLEKQLQGELGPQLSGDGESKTGSETERIDHIEISTK
jgi:hypothetical protein